MRNPLMRNNMADGSNIDNKASDPSQHFNVGSTLFQRCGPTLKQQ